MIAYDDGTLTCCEVAVFWVECDRHDEEGCYMAVCEVCDAVDRDCEGMELSFLANIHGGGEWIVTDSSGAILGKFENQDDAQDWIDEQ